MTLWQGNPVVVGIDPTGGGVHLGYEQGRRRGRRRLAGPACQRERKVGSSCRSKRGGGEARAAWAGPRCGPKWGGKGVLGRGGEREQARGETGAGPRANRTPGRGGTSEGWLVFSFFFLFHFNFLFFYFPKHFPKELLSINNLQQKTINKNQICSNMYAQHVSKLMMNFIFHQKLFKC